ncbi:hypothetical protein GW943_03240 [Candidatus Parcubacteria bacterium]|uniref:DUF11 domain-containing protein n=1 Tax=Candidatus Kaiserbacteria bacterium CG10_big_fil_rev_8_21_14_0_10_47_16 TaxID=1974608 RepID=A0A2H0UEJ5_9BACT|nr:hypothetical protein [Candidatus Parcubacteria bacterium]PIR84844.1 MAG: hypothetical protein COU16_00450 [Candidatus Kaiserbacteria bacterium CG10_big_fil_rev_8_21_14_0_10_47_16]
MAETPKKKSATTRKVKPEAGEASKIDALSERLYARGAQNSQVVRRTKLERKTAPVARDWNESGVRKNAERQRAIRSIEAGNIARPRPITQQPAPKPKQPLFQQAATVAATQIERVKRSAARLEDSVTMSEEFMTYPTRSRKYRTKLLLGGVIFFAVMLILSGLFFVFGNNTISGANINVAVTGDFAVSAGEEMTIHIAISNDNDVNIDSATLVIGYPSGTQKADGSGKELYTERLPLESLKSGEVRNIETKAVVFGEENSEKSISVAVEYRISGSNSTFYKEADPYRFKISSSPVVILIDAPQTVTVGQDTTIVMTVGSNSPTSLDNVLVTVDYPSGFTFTSADPAPVSGSDTWRINTLDPESKTTITIHGTMNGAQGDKATFTASTGVSSSSDRFSLASLYSTNTFDIRVGSAFLDVAVTINGSSDEDITLGKGEEGSVRIDVLNTLDEAIYDGEVVVTFGGSAANGVVVNAGNGSYNASAHTITWDSGGVSSLGEIGPGKKSNVSFFVTIPDGVQSPELTLSVSVSGTHVSNRVPESLKDTKTRTIRVAGSASVSTEVSYGDKIFSNSGPVPPVAGDTTTYSVTFFVQNGGNALTGATLTATLPSYVAWKNKVTSGDDISFDQGSRTLIWNIGSIPAKGSTSASVQLGLTPSTAQVGKIPTLVESQQFKATDSFTSATTRSTSGAVNTVLLEKGEGSDSGTVRASE